jgi:hypothetical protein
MRMKRGALQAKILDEILRQGMKKIRTTGLNEFVLIASDVAKVIYIDHGPRTRAVCRAAINGPGLAARGLELIATDFFDGNEKGDRWFRLRFCTRGAS